MVAELLSYKRNKKLSLSINSFKLPSHNINSPFPLLFGGKAKLHGYRING